LVVTSSSVAFGDVVVPVPGQGSQILVRTDHADLRQSQYVIYDCRVQNPQLPIGRQGRISQGGCGWLKTATLNKVTPVASGTYRLIYEGSFMDVDVADGQSVEIDLRKIKVPRAQTGTYFRVIWDLSDPIVQSLYAQVSWERYGYANDIYQACRWADPVWHYPGRFCHAFNQGDFQTWSRQGFQFQPNQGVSALVYDSARRGFVWRDYGWVMVNESWIEVGSDDGVVLTFPGRYSVVFSFPDGSQRIQSGVVVQ
jgi:hypothetical protein